MASKKLGRVLKDARLKRGFTLREVEKITNHEVSNSYLSQIETGKVDNVSPGVLWLLAGFYKVKFVTLMELAGHVTKWSNQ